MGLHIGIHFIEILKKKLVKNNFFNENNFTSDDKIILFSLRPQEILIMLTKKLKKYTKFLKMKKISKL